MTEIKKLTADVRGQIAKSANEIESDIWRLRSELGLPPSAKERAFVEFCKHDPEFRALLEKESASARRSLALARPDPDYLD